MTPEITEEGVEGKNALEKKPYKGMINNATRHSECQPRQKQSQSSIRNFVTKEITFCDAENHGIEVRGRCNQDQAHWSDKEDSLWKTERT